MIHWSDPHTRGVYDHPAAVPPRPMPSTHNDIPSRVARLEEHVHYAAMNQRRMEEESRLRGKDVTGWVDNLNVRLSILEQERHTRRKIRKLAWTIGTGGGALLRYVLAGFLAILLLTGKASLDQIKFLFGVLGWPAG